MEELNTNIIGNDLEKLLSEQKSFEKEQELEWLRIVKLREQQRSENFSKFTEVYRSLIEPCFKQFAIIFEKNGHKLILKHEQLDEISVRPEVQYDLLVNSIEYNNVQIYIFGNGFEKNVTFYFKKNNNEYKKTMQFEQLTTKAIESIIVQAMSMQTK